MCVRAHQRAAQCLLAEARNWPPGHWKIFFCSLSLGSQARASYLTPALITLSATTSAAAIRVGRLNVRPMIIKPPEEGHP